MEIFKKYTFILIIVLGFLLWPSFSSAIDSETYIYLFHLHYDKGVLVKDRDFEFAYELIGEPYVIPPEELEGEEFATVIYSSRGTIIDEYNFSIPDSSNYQGKISVTAPFFAYAQKADFFDNNDRLLLSIDLSPSSFCNENGKCDKDVGEDSANCPSDCKEETATEGGFDVIKAVFIALAAAAGLFVLWMVWTIIKKRRGTGGPTLPTSGSQIPAPPIPPINPPLTQ